MGGLRLENISKRFGKIIALSDISFEIKDGAFCVVLGPSGCGKSTLLNLIAGLEEATTGRIYLGDRDITEVPAHKRDIAMVFQSYALYPHLSVFENMAFGLRIKGLKAAEIRAKIKQVSQILNIEDKLASLPRELSGGQRQRVATGRAIVREPELFLFDEPLSNLDARLRVQLRAEFIKLHKQLNKTIIYVTHDQVEAMALGNMVVLIKDGKIQQISTPQGLYQDPGNLFAAEFIGIPPMNIIKLKISIDNLGLVLTRDEFKFEIPLYFEKQLERLVNQEIYFGFRPSGVSPVRCLPSNGVSLSGKGKLKGEVIFTETIGEDSFAHLKLGKTIEINVKIPDTPKLNSGDLVSLTIDPARMYFFDTSGARISGTVQN